MTGQTRLRCAIYTRKSSEEGLEQDFNSLDAQREACEAYIRSQVELGWQILKERYDDGGYSGGTLERPALQRLQQEVRERRLDIIVIYKIDRLTRSLTDFARLAELLDTHGVSFVSVTQQFNTTTSMGRLMLNVLLSFAQFEREITGERIRDKIAASKKKGMWMGGIPPLGYNAVDRALVVNEAEAAGIRIIYRLYLEFGSVRRLEAKVRELGLRTRTRQKSSGTVCGGRPLSRGHLYRILQNPVYIGRIRHLGVSYDGQHPAIVDPDTWERVQQQLKDNRQGHRHRIRAQEPSLLAGLLWDEQGRRLVPSHATKGERRYRYYVCEELVRGEAMAEGLRLPAAEIEGAVRGALLNALKSSDRLIELLDRRLSAQQTAIATLTAKHRYLELRRATSQQWIEALRSLVKRIEVHPGTLQLILRKAPLAEWAGAKSNSLETTGTTTLTIPAELRQRGNQVRVVIQRNGHDVARGPDAVLVGIVARAMQWRRHLESGEIESFEEIAAAEKVTSSYVGRVLRLAYLAPDIIEAIVNGHQPVQLSAQQLLYRHDLPLEWPAQRESLGFTCS